MGNTLGEKIRFFRKRAGLTQVDVEIECDMSSGVLSRIEQGTVNPTKETLLNISRTLNLSQNELADLFEIRPLYPTKTEIEEAMAEVKERFARPDVFAYLIDEWTAMHAVSKGFIDVLELGGHLDQVLGQCLCETAFDINIPIRQHLDPDFISVTFAFEFARLRGEIPTFEKSDLFHRLSKIPEFGPIYEIAKSIPVGEIINPENKIAHFVLDGTKMVMNFSREKLKSNPRFEVFEFFNPRPYAE